MKLLITGGLGFIGLNYVLENYNKYNITVIDKQTYASNPVELLPKNVNYIHADICSINKLNIDADFDWIIHFAAESHVDNALFDATPFWDSNVKGTYELSLFALKHKIKFFHVSTDEVFGEWVKGQPLFDEDSKYKPNNMYSVSKAASDQIIRAQSRSYGLEYIIINCCNNYGNYQHKEKFIPKILTGKVSLHGKGKTIREWINVKDTISAIDLIMRKSINETYLVSSREYYTNQQVAEMAGAKFNYSNNRPGVDIGYRSDPSKLEKLGFQPKFKLKDYLASTLITV